MPADLKRYQDISRSSLFFSKWQWCVTVGVPDGHLLRELDQKKFEDIVERRRAWGGKISEDAKKYLNRVRDFVLAIQYPHLRSVTYNTFYFYTNDIALLDDIEQSDLFVVQGRRRARVDQPQGVLVRHNPQHQIRTYLHDRSLSPDQASQLFDFFKNRDDLKISPSLMQVLRDPRFNWTRRYHWFDHDHAGECTFLSMICPGIVRQSMPIQAK